MTIIIHTGGDPGNQYWVDESGHFTNQDRIEEDSDFVAAGDIDPAGAGEAVQLLAKRSLPITGPDVGSFSLLALKNGLHGTVARFTPDGHPVILPNPTTGETVVEDEKVGGAIIRPGAVAPIETDYLGVRLLHFQVNDEASVSIQMSHGWRPGTSLRFHIHLGLPVAAGTPARIRFQATYFISAQDLIATGPTTITKEAVVSGYAQYREVVIYFDAISMAGYAQESAILGVKVKRIAATANEYGSNPALLSADAHYSKEKMGTRQDLPPYTP